MTLIFPLCFREVIAMTSSIMPVIGVYLLMNNMMVWKCGFFVFNLSQTWGGGGQENNADNCVIWGISSTTTHPVEATFAVAKIVFPEKSIDALKDLLIIIIHP